MEQRQLEGLKRWFDGYVRSFYGDDAYVNANLKRKEDHTRRICGEMLYLAKELGLDQSASNLAEAIALLHDAGRFSQFVKYRTYNDAKSTNHSLIALDELKKAGVLGPLDAVEREIIEKTILWHGEKELPPDLDGDLLRYAKMIRDADKVDIYFTVTSFYVDYAKNPDKVRLIEIEVEDRPGEYTQAIVEQILRGERIDYRQLNTWNDMKLLQLAWVYDINYVPMLKRIRQRRYVETILEYLPKDEQMKEVWEKITGYIEERIAKG
jgi:hypothetical protein